jgi:hypothetical protein
METTTSLQADALVGNVVPNSGLLQAFAGERFEPGGA